jgi:hypothetical protein
MRKELFAKTRKIQKKMFLSTAILSLSIAGVLAMDKKGEDHKKGFPPHKSSAKATASLKSDSSSQGRGKTKKKPAAVAAAAASASASAGQKPSGCQLRSPPLVDDLDRFYNHTETQTDGSQDVEVQVSASGAATSSAASGRKSPRIGFVPSAEGGGWEDVISLGSQPSSQKAGGEQQAASGQAPSSLPAAAASNK